MNDDDNATEFRADRLLNVAKALRESPRPEAFTMGYFGHGDSDPRHPCGTPACALGHYAARKDLQDDLALDRNGSLVCVGRLSPLNYDSVVVQRHFGITHDEAGELFASPRDYDDDEPLGAGCGNAQTAIAAAEYIEAFVARRIAP